MPDVLILVSRGGTALALGLIAGWLLWMKFRSPVHQTFAVFCSLYAARVLFRGLALYLGPDEHANSKGIAPAAADLFNQFSNGAVIGACFALAAFLIALLLPRNRWARIVRWTLAVAGAGIAGWALFDLCSVACGETSEATGPLLVPANFLNLSLGMAALILALAIEHAPGARGPRARAVLLVAFAIGLLGMFMSLVDGLLQWLDKGRLVLLVRALGIVPAFAALAIVAIREWTQHARARTLIMATVAILLAALATWAGSSQEEVHWPQTTGLVSVVFPLLVAYALLRHRLFGIDVKVRWTLKKVPLGTAMLAIFLVVSQVVEQTVSGLVGEAGGAAWGWVLGGIGAGLALLALHPLQKLGDRFAATVLPEAESGKRIRKDKRMEIYRDQVRLVWQDGVMGPKERILLDHLRDQLGISYEQAATLEHAAAQDAAGRRPSARTSTRLTRSP